MKISSSLRVAALTAAAAALMFLGVSATLAGEGPCPPKAPYATPYYAPAEPTEPSWIFRRGTFTNDPETGARVAQYMRTPPVEPLDDPRAITSRYTRRRTNLRGANGSLDTYYEVQNWGNGRGGLDAEWERFHDAWKDSFLQGGFYNQGPWGYGRNPGGYGPGYGYGNPGYGFPGNGFPDGGYRPGYGYGPGRPGHGGRPDYGDYQPGYGQPPYNHGGGRGRHNHDGGHDHHGGGGQYGGTHNDGQRHYGAGANNQ